ncbi:GtrA family protein [Ferruginibacter sp.]|nr:GtrA family protein [Ferruginibacter sp.]
MPKDKIISTIDFFYPLFRKFMPLQTFRYAACGGGNTILSILVFNFSDTIIFKEEDVHIGIAVLKSYNAALFISFCISFTVGFLLMKYVVFVDSNIKGRIQLFRYLVTYCVNLVLMYLLLKLFVEYANLDKWAAQLITTAVVITLSYLAQKHFTFRTKKAVNEDL